MPSRIQVVAPPPLFSRVLAAPWLDPSIDTVCVLGREQGFLCDPQSFDPGAELEVAFAGAQPLPIEGHPHPVLFSLCAVPARSVDIDP